MGQLHTSYHEAGHVVAALRFGQVVTDVSIIPEGNTDGRTMLSPASAGWLENSEEAVVYLLAGWAGERMTKFHDSFADSRIDPINAYELSRGASDDAHKAGERLRSLHPNHDLTVSRYEENIGRLFEKALDEATRILEENEPILGGIAKELRAKKVLTQADAEKWRPLIKERGNAAGVCN